MLNNTSCEDIYKTINQNIHEIFDFGVTHFGICIYKHWWWDIEFFAIFAPQYDVRVLYNGFKCFLELMFPNYLIYVNIQNFVDGLADRKEGGFIFIENQSLS